MKQTKYTKWVDNNGNYSHTIELTDGQKFKNVSVELGVYLSKLERENRELSQLQAKHEEELKELKSLLEESRSIYKEDSRAHQEWEARLCKIM